MVQSRAEQSRAEQSRAEQSRAEQSRAEQSRAEQSRNRIHVDGAASTGNSQFDFQGDNNLVRIGADSKLQNCNLHFQGNRNVVSFGTDCDIRGMHMLILGDGNVIDIGNKVTINASPIQPTVINAVGSRRITIGEGSLFSNNIEIHTSDYHGIYDKNGNRVNPDKDIVIGKYVWIGLGCKILKGAKISDGSVVGAGTVVTKSFDEKNVILAGNPAGIVKRQIFWKHWRADACPVPRILQKAWNLNAAME